MGKRKLSIDNAGGKSEMKAATKTAFHKRKLGLLRKAYELSALCQCEIAMIILHQGRLIQFASSDMDQLLLRYTEARDTQESRTNQDIEKYLSKKDKNGGSDDDDDDEEDGFVSTEVSPSGLMDAVSKRPSPVTRHLEIRPAMPGSKSMPEMNFAYPYPMQSLPSPNLGMMDYQGTNYAQSYDATVSSPTQELFSQGITGFSLSPTQNTTFVWPSANAPRMTASHPNAWPVSTQPSASSSTGVPTSAKAAPVKIVRNK